MKKPDDYRILNSCGNCDHCRVYWEYDCDDVLLCSALISDLSTLPKAGNDGYWQAQDFDDLKVDRNGICCLHDLRTPPPIQRQD